MTTEQDRKILGLTDYGPQTSDWDRDWDRCGGVRSVLAGRVQVCGHNVPTIHTSVPHLRRGHPKGGDGWGQYSSQVSGEPIVLQMAAQPCPPERSNFGSGTERFTGNNVYLECCGAEITLLEYCWKMLSNVCLSCSRIADISPHLWHV